MSDKSPSGFLNVNKPAGVTSRDIVNQVQRLFGGRRTKVGHAGTLDPLATGVLVVAVGQATRLVEYVQQMRKTYVAKFLLGRHSDTEDIEGTVVEQSDATVPSEAELRYSLPPFVGQILQRPPVYSALKVNGQRAYALARKGESVQLDARPIQIYSLELERFQYPEMQLRIECGSGTYVRSLGRDIAESLRTSAIMSELVRTQIGAFHQSNSLDPLLFSPGYLQSHLQPLVMATNELTQIPLDSHQQHEIQFGRSISVQTHVQDEFAALDANGHLLAIMDRSQSGHWRPKKNFCVAD
ncbi:MAG: tRNA pseudouridine(55) synthase TruB [Planctomycetales bacterium]|nr:tRNA pseudouridine(55) synthase TruB [Planctomycetales bacterium]